MEFRLFPVFLLSIFCVFYLPSTSASEIQSKLSSFLREIDDLDGNSSLGMLAAGIETVNHNIEASVNALNTQETASSEEEYERDNEVLRSQAEELRDRIAEDEYEVEDLRRRIEGEEMAVGGAGLGCGEHAECRDCAEDASCVWCVATQSCMTGGPEGPDADQCTDFEYRMCQSAVCESINSCLECLQNSDCGWCATASTCIPSNQSSNLCDSSHYFSLSLGLNFNTCPSPPPPPITPTPPEPAPVDYRVRQIQNYQSRVTDLQAEITRLTNELDRLNALISEPQPSEVPANFTSLDGLSAQVDQQVLSEQSFFSPEGPLSDSNARDNDELGEEPSPSTEIASAVNTIRAEAAITESASDIAQNAASNAQSWSELAQNYTNDLEFTLDAANSATNLLEITEKEGKTGNYERKTEAYISFLQTVFDWGQQV